MSESKLPGRVMWFAESPNGSLASAESEEDAEYMAAMERSAWARQFVLFTPNELSAYIEARERAAFEFYSKDEYGFVKPDYVEAMLRDFRARRAEGEKNGN